jgi:hypothetical protein
MSYTVEQEARLKEFGPISYEDAVALGEEFGKSTRSVIAKVKTFPEIDYIPKVVPAKRPKGATKAELVAEIENRLADKDGVPVLAGLQKATAQSLARLVEAL